MSIYKKGLAAASLMLVFLALTAFHNPNPTYATEPEANTMQSISSSSQQEDHLHSATLVYDDDTIDVFRNTYIISIDDHKDIDLTFDTSNSATNIKLRNITEDGDAKFVCETTTKNCHFNATEFLPNSGVEIVIYDKSNNIIRQTMLGLIIKQNAMKEKYDVPVTIGPGSGIRIDMGSVAKGMNFTINPITIPVRYEHYADGRSVLGIGTNSTDEKFWEDAAKDRCKQRISDANLYKKWKEENKRQGGGGSLGLTWLVAGYATSYDNNPQKMTGTIQVYVGSGYNYTGQYAIFTYSVTVTWGATGEFVFTINPALEQRVSASFNLALSAGLELYGGIGSGYLASIGVYGAAKVGTAMKVLPRFSLDSLYLSGEVGLKAKVLGRDAFTFTFTSGTKEFIEKLESDGTTSYSTDLSLKDIMIEKRDELLANNYGNQPAGEIALQQGETKWDLNNLDIPTPDDQTQNTFSTNGTLSAQGTLEQNNLLIDSPQQQVQSDRNFAHRIAENVYPHSGTQVIKAHMNTTQAVAVFASNSGELNYSVFDWYYQNMTEPRQVAGSGQDFNARLIRGSYSNQSYLVWQRLGNTGANDATLSQVAASGDIHIARFNYDNKTFVDHEPVTENSDEIYGGVAVSIGSGYENNSPYVFAYTNPTNDPEGIANYSYHNILSFHKESGTWVRRVIAGYQGVISSFDANLYDGRESVALTLETDNGNTKTSYVISPSGESSDTLATFDDAWGVQFNGEGDSPAILVFMKDGKLMSSTGGGRTERAFGNDEHKLPTAPFTIIGDVTGKFMVSYLSSVDSHQNLIGFVKSGGTENYEPLVVTNVGDNSNVTYFGGVFIGPNWDPFIVYTVQNYRKVALWWEEGQADMYALSGTSTNHISVISSDVTNLEDLAVTTNVAKVDALLKNTGLFDIKNFSLYLKDKGAPDSQYTKFGDYTIPTLRPGEFTTVEIELPESDYTNPHSYMLGATSRDSEYDSIGIQSEHLVDIPEGPTRISDADYNFRTYYHRDTYTATIKSYGPGIKKGKIVFYNTANLEVYQETPFDNLAPGAETSATLGLQFNLLSRAYKNLGVRVLNNDEELDDTWPTGKFRQTELLPKWFEDHVNVRGATGAIHNEDDDILVPDTGRNTIIIATASGCTMCVTFIIATTTLHFLRRRKKD